jgi:hypothetical protein
LHDFVEDIAGVECGDRMIATGEIAEVVEVATGLVGKLLFDETDRLLVVVGEQAHEGCFLRMHALVCN